MFLCDYTWTKPDSEGKEYSKIGFVKYFKPFNWVIGTGDYIDEVEQEIQKEILERFSHIRFGKDGYLFVVDYEGMTLMNATQPHLIGKNIWDLEDPNGVKVIQEEKKAAETTGGDFIYYVWNKPSEVKPSPKISFVKGFPEWQWMIGAGVYLEDVQSLLLAQRQKLKSKLIIQLIFILTILCATTIALTILAKRLYTKISYELKVFDDFFESAASEDVKIDPENLTFEEIKKIAYAANKMVEARVLVETKLRGAVNIIDNSPAVVFRWKNENGWPVEYVSNNVANILGYSAETFITGDLSYIEVIHPDDIDRVSMEVSESSSVDGKSSFVHEPYRIITVDGTTKWIEDKTHIIRGVGGEVTHFEGIIQDITFQVEARKTAVVMEERLLQAQKMEAIGTLAGGIAHDFNNSLSIILGYAGLAKIDAPPDTRLKNDLDNILIAANRAKELINQILVFSRQVQVKRRPIQIQPIIKEALKLLRSSIPTTISITENIDPQCGTVLADPTQVHQILMNLCTNAYHAMEQTGGEMSVSLKPSFVHSNDFKNESNRYPGEYVEITVSDNGCGIGSDVIDKIFDPYFTTKEVGKGTGIGLSIIHGIASECGGTITVDSQHGKGSSFHVYLPVIEKEVYLEQEEHDRATRGKERILFVDDEVLLVRLGKDVLERLGYKVTPMYNSLEALATFQNSPDDYDIIITDQTMPGMTGFDLAKRMLQIRPNIPIILCTGYSDLVDESSATALGIKAFALKPLTNSAITRLIRKALGETPETVFETT